MSARADFKPIKPLIEGLVHPVCRASVIIPARNEESTLSATLDALAVQVDCTGRPLRSESFEILLLLNNCTDNTAVVARRWKQAYPEIMLHIIERTLPCNVAHVGMARRLLMDTAWCRLSERPRSIRGILSTDSDTQVAPNWVAQSLRALECGADAVGGVIRLRQADLDSLPDGARQAYLRDRRYQKLVAELESFLDPQLGDPWPRHLEHFGASLACTPQAYARAGGMPPVRPLEDVAFVDALRRVDARLRHEPEVLVYTSSRMEGRVEVGLSCQLREWQQMSEAHEEHRVPSTAWLIHRFRTLRKLRRICLEGQPSKLTDYPASWRGRIAEAHRRCTSIAQFLAEIDCDRLIEHTFDGHSEGEITQVCRNLANAIQIRRLRFSSPASSYSIVTETFTGTTQSA